MAYADEEVRKIMKVEDEVLKDLTNAERRAEKAEQIAEEAQKIAEQKAKEAEQERKEKEIVKQNLLETAKLLKQMGVDTDTIVLKTGLTKSEIEKL